jgi:hypothetical protein
MKSPKCGPLIVLVIATTAASTAASQPQEQSPGPNEKALHDQIATVKKRLASTGLPAGSWVADARAQIGALTKLGGVTSVIETSCFGGGCYATVTYTSSERATPAQRSIFNKLKNWEFGIFVSGIEVDSEGNASSVVALAGKNS